jgi:phospholipid/cholesterol/gamma-HCH transport system substrate-binding protein
MTATQRRKHGLVLLSFIVLSAGVFTLLLNLSGGTSLAAKYNFEAVVPDVVQLAQGATVREAGVNVGTVSGISNRGDSAVIGISLNKNYAPIYKDGTVRVATKTLVGENYIDLNPGEALAGAVPANGTLPISQAQDAVQLDQILSTFTPSVQAKMRRLLAGFGGGLSNSGPQLNQTIDALSGTLNNAAPVAQALSDQSQQLATFATNLGDVLDALGQRSTQIQQFVTAGTRTAVTIAARDRALRADLKALPPTISTVARVTRHLAAVGTTADPVLDNLGDALGDLTPALKDLPAAGAATVSALNRLKDVTPVASRLATALKQTAPSVTQVVAPLASFTNQLDPTVRYLQPYTTDIQRLLEDMDSLGSTSDANGVLAQLLPVLSASSIQSLSSTDKQLLNTIVGAGAAQIINLSGHNSYPAPGTADSPQPLTTTYPRVQAETGG